MTAETRAAEVLAEHVEAWQSDGDYGEKVWLECAVTSCEWNDREALDDIDAERASFYAHVAAALSAAGCLRDDREGAPSVLADLMAAVYGDAEGVDPEEQAEIKRRMTAVLAARDDREGETVTEWGVDAPGYTTALWHPGEFNEEWARDVSREDGATLVSRQRTRFPDVVTDWSPVTPDGGDHPPCCGPTCEGLSCWDCRGTGHPHTPDGGDQR